MNLTNKQKFAIEKISGKNYGYFNSISIDYFFKYTDKGIKTSIENIPIEARDDYNRLLEYHHWHTTDVEMWKNDFIKGLLFLSDFNGTPIYMEHVKEIYKQAFIDKYGICPSFIDNSGGKIDARSNEEMSFVQARV